MLLTITQTFIHIGAEVLHTGRSHPAESTMAHCSSHRHMHGCQYANLLFRTVLTSKAVHCERLHRAQWWISLYKSSIVQPLEILGRVKCQVCLPATFSLNDAFRISTKELLQTSYISLIWQSSVICMQVHYWFSRMEYLGKKSKLCCISLSLNPAISTLCGFYLS